MKRIAAGFLIPALLSTSAFADPVTPGHLMATVSTYKPMAAFNHVIGQERFVGYFLARPDRCDVTVFQVDVDDETLTTPPRRTLLSIGAGGRSELATGPGSALAIACTIDADAIKIAPQTTGLTHAAKVD